MAIFPSIFAGGKNLFIKIKLNIVLVGENI